MQRRMTTMIGQTAILHQHIWALAPRLLPRIMLAGVCVLSAAFWHRPTLMIAGALWMIIMALIQIVAWRIYSVRLQSDRVLVRRLRLGAIEETIYSIIGLRGLIRRQSFLGRLFDTGTIVLMLPNRMVCLTMLTPFSAADALLDFDY